MVGRRFLPWVIAPLLAVAAPSAAQFVPRDAMIPAERAAQSVPADRAAPTPADIDRIAALENQVRIDQPCNTTWQPELEAPRRALLALYEGRYGPDHPATARPLLSLLCHFAYNDKASSEPDAIVARLIAIGRARDQPLALYAGLSARAQRLREQGKAEAAVADAREALALARQHLGARPAIVASAAASLAAMLEGAGRPVDAEPLLHQAAALRQALPGGDRFELAAAYEALGNNLGAQMRIDDARLWYARELDIFEAALADADVGTLTNIILYSQRVFTADPARVDALYRAVLAREEALPGSSDARNWMTLWNLAKSSSLRLDLPNAAFRDDLSEAIAYQRRVIAAVGIGPDGWHERDLARLLAQNAATAAEAETIYRRYLAADPDDIQLVEMLGDTLWMLGRYDEALPLRQRSIADTRARLGASHRETLRQTYNLGVTLWGVRRPAEARPYYEDVLAGYRAELSALPETANAAYRLNLANFISGRAIDLLRLHWTTRAADGASGEAASRTRGFAVAQLAHPSASGAAISETAARALAERAGKTAPFLRWTAARDRVVSLDKAIEQAAQRGAAGDADRVGLLADRAAAGEALAAAAAALRDQLPDVFATLRPEPVSLAEVAGGGGKAALLRKDEALVLLYPGMPDARGEMSRGIAFAVTREGSAWAEIPIDGADLTRIVGTLDGQLADSKHSGLTILEAGENPDTYLRYDRAAAYRVYQALFGDPAIAALLQGKERWIVVPEGPLLALNFAALVTRPPPGGAAGDIDPATLRATTWLGLERIVAVAPSVDAVRTARRTANPARASGKFYGMGDPAFRGVADPAPKPLPGRLRGAPVAASTTANTVTMPRQRLYRDGVADPAMLAKLPRLEYSAAEVRRMAELLDAPTDRQWLQLDATQARLDRNSVDGTLGDSAIVLFATHALLGGSFDGTLAEPALALTPATPIAGATLDAKNDGLLTASEVAQLRFRAALVILSACDTAAGADGGDGFSGLTRAFLLAGARAVLATYSPVIDEVGERMTTTAIARLGDQRGDIAAALRDAMRTVAADPSEDARGESLAHPAAWAVYVAIDPS
jgi:CHAT domain-containing protein